MRIRDGLRFIGQADDGAVGAANVILKQVFGTPTPALPQPLKHHIFKISGKTYEAWVIAKGSAPRPAGLFSGGGNTMVHLRGTVPPHAVVAVTVERAGGVSAPTTTPIFSTPT